MANRNLITDVAGLLVGHAHDDRLLSGVTVLLPDPRRCASRPLVAAVDVRGGGPGTRETDALSLSGTVEEVHGLVFSGGSAFGLAAASGVQGWLAQRGQGFAIAGARVPIVPQAILFDLANGGDKGGALASAYMALGEAACGAAGPEFALGSVGAGMGATTATLRGGLGSASFHFGNGLAVGALACVNPVGSVTIGDTDRFWAGAEEANGEYGGRGLPSPWPADAFHPRLKGQPGLASAGASTTLGLIATNARLDKRMAQRLAVMAQTGLARAVFPVHTPLDGDVVFAVATGDCEVEISLHTLARLGAGAAVTLARAIARGVFEAQPAPPAWTGPPAYRTRFP